MKLSYQILLVSLITPFYCHGLVIQTDETITELLTGLGFLGHSEIDVLSAEIKFGGGDDGISAEFAAASNSMNFMLTNNAAETVLISSASSGKKQGESGFSAPKSIGTFGNSDNTYQLPDSGIVMSTGNVLDYGTGANTSGSNTTAWGNSATTEQHSMLSQVSGAGSTFFDVTQIDIEFNVSDDLDTLSFLAAFGSDEYSTYQNTAFNDGFGLFLNGENIAASIPDGESLAQTINITHSGMEALVGTELDGVIQQNSSPLLRFETAIDRGSQNNILSLIIADRADQLFDSTVYVTLEEQVTNTIPPSNGQPTSSGDFLFGVPFGDEVLLPVCLDCLSGVASSGKKYKSSGAKFASIAMPTLATINDPDGFELWVWNGNNFIFETKLLPNEIFDFTTINLAGIDQFLIKDINPDHLLDLNDPRAFVLGANFIGDIDSLDLSISLISLPGTIYLFGLGLIPCIYLFESKGRRAGSAKLLS